MDKEHRFIILDLYLRLPNGAHSNVVVIDTKKKIVELFEPHGGRDRSVPVGEYKQGLQNVQHYTNASNVIKQYFKIFFKDYKYISPKEFLPERGLQDRIYGPYCHTWCIMYCHYKMLNKDVPSNVIAKRMTQITESEFLRYMKFIENTIKNKKSQYKSKSIKSDQLKNDKKTKEKKNKSI